MHADDVSFPEHEPLLEEAENDNGDASEGIALEDFEPRSSAESHSTRDSSDGESLSLVAHSLPQEHVVWTAEEERRVVRKLDCLVMPLLIIAFFALQLDRANIGNALTDFLLPDVGITQSQFNVGQQLLSLGIVLWEIPSNLVLYRIGPSIWLSCQILAWGLVATFQAFQHGVYVFLITRFLLGSCESGFIPASFFTITRFYKRDETSKRFSWFFIGNMFSQAVSGLLAYGILHMRGLCGLAGWQWLFILEGLFTIAVGFLFVALFPISLGKPSSLTRINYFTDRERDIMVRRVLADDPSKLHNRSDISWAELKDTFTNWRLIAHVVLTIAGLAPTSTLLNYGPTLVEGWGYGRLRSNAMVSIGPWFQLVLNILWGTLADKFQRRGTVTLVGIFFWWLFALVCRSLVNSPDGTARFATMMVAYAFSQIWHPVNSSWMALNAATSGERSITMALVIMSANTSGIIGSQLFQESDGPLYPKGWSAIVALISLALVAVIVANIQYRFMNRRLQEKGVTPRYFI